MKGASLATEEIWQGVRGRLVWDESETVSSFDRWSFGERRTKRLLSYGLKLNFIDSSVKGETFWLLFFRKLRAQTYILKSIDRWSFGERRTKKGYLAMVWSWTFIDISVNFGVYQRLIRRRFGVNTPFTSGVCVRTTTTCTPSATIKTSRRTVVVQRHGRRRTVLSVRNKVTNDYRTIV